MESFGRDVAGFEFVLEGVPRRGTPASVIVAPFRVVWPEIGADLGNLVHFDVDVRFRDREVKGVNSPLKNARAVDECSIGELARFHAALQIMHHRLRGEATFECNGVCRLWLSVMDRAHGLLLVHGSISEPNEDWTANIVPAIDRNKADAFRLEFAFTVEQTFIPPFISQIALFLEHVETMRRHG